MGVEVRARIGQCDAAKIYAMPDICGDMIDTVAVVRSLWRNDPPVVVYAKETHHEDSVCGQCRLQAHCHDLFGDKGRDCTIHRKRMAWEEASPEMVSVFHMIAGELEIPAATPEVKPMVLVDFDKKRGGE